ncbi:FliH/SctL family protein [Arthrobacter sp. H14-L1]|uniref:FliH/SctL family protein n=1 Tax=Arthrobacter sp. H14-L1 TaxID=2996697 RepID=UPI00226F0626|nr:FliH/SctL family protein [Arthrobacter sp. H14-L1]MCY0903383.1 FliH/SctL family protein [Arthrobacter sp. H14-L1]
MSTKFTAASARDFATDSTRTDRSGHQVPRTAAGATFKPISFAAVDSDSPDSPGSPGYIRGHSIGYTFGMRAAAAEAKIRRAEMDDEHAAAMVRQRAELDRVVGLLTAAQAALNAVVLPVVTEAQDVLLAGAVDLAEAILGHELAQGPASARSALTRALGQQTPAGTYAVRMNPADLADLNELDDPSLGQAGIRFVPDAALARGDAIAEFEHGYLDARIAAALARTKDALVEDQQ